MHYAKREAAEIAEASQREIQGLWVQLFEAASLVEEATSLVLQDMDKPRMAFDQAIGIAEAAIRAAASSQAVSSSSSEVPIQPFNLSKSMDQQDVQIFPSKTEALCLHDEESSFDPLTPCESLTNAIRMKVSKSLTPCAYHTGGRQ